MNTYSFQPLIGISGGLIRTNEWSPRVVGHRQSYVEAVLLAGGLPVVLPPLTDPRALHGLYERLDGLLLAGGDDIDPVCYGEAPHPRLGAVSPERDTAELLLARWAFADDRPLLGICRGLQVINVARGGTLWQDLPSDNPEGLDHYASATLQRWDAVEHPVALADGSRLAGLLGTTAIGLNSLHHQAVKRLGSGLRAVGYALDGVVEAIEGEGEAFVVGVQGPPRNALAGGGTPLAPALCGPGGGRQADGDAELARRVSGEEPGRCGNTAPPRLPQLRPMPATPE